MGTALALAWAAYAKDDPRTVKVGIRVWLLTLVVGMVLRRLTDAGTAPSFVVVATLVLGVLFVGWRLVASSRAGVRDPLWTSPRASRPCGVSQPDVSGPFGTIPLGLTSPWTT